jgi:alkylation response protein AidB-like acyl-CoA dehydrogenase
MPNDFEMSALEQDIRQAVRALCARLPGAYWRQLDRDRAYPEAFVKAMTEAGWLSILIPEQYGGGGMGISAAAAVLEEVHHAGGNAAACHAQMYIMGTLLRHGSPEQKDHYLPRIASGELRLQAFGVTEPDAGSDTTRIRTQAERSGDRYIINGQKVFTSRAEHSDLLLLLARTAPYDPERRTQGLSTFLVDMRDAVNKGLEIRPLETMINHATTELFFDNLEIPADNLIGAEGEGFRYILDGMNAERILIAAECIGDGRWFIERAARYGTTREVFGRAIGANQGIQFPVAQAYAQVEAAHLMRVKAAQRFEANQPCGPEANMAKLLASEAAWQAANVCLDTHGGYGFATEYDVERKFRETRLYKIAPINNNLILAYLAHNVLGMPRSY